VAAAVWHHVADAGIVSAPGDGGRLPQCSR